MTTKAIIHIGSDKAGSSSLQYFLGRNREALSARGFHLIEASYARGGGHPYLFRDLAHPSWVDAQRETAEYGGDHTLLFTWEGIHHFSAEDLERLKALLPGVDVSFVFYIREQAELIQSGLLQRIKQNNLQDCDFLDLPLDSAHLTPNARDYEMTLERFENAYGRGSVDVRVFERDRLVGGDVKSDFLSAIGVDDIDGFEQTKDLNESLWIEAGVAIQMLDPLALSEDDQRALRDAGIAVSATHRGSRHFLRREQVERVRDRYAASNRRVAQRFFDRDDLFNLKPCHVDGPLDRQGISNFMREMLFLWPRFPVVWGRRPAREVIASRGTPAEGWRLDGDLAVLGADRAPLMLQFAPRSLFPDHRVGTIKIEPPSEEWRPITVFRRGETYATLASPRDRITLPLRDTHPYGVADLELAVEGGDQAIASFYVKYA